MQGMTERLEAMLAKGTDNMLLRFAGKAYAEQDCYGDAERHLRVALEFDPDYSVAWKWLGKACSGRQGEARGRESGLEAARARGDQQVVKEPAGLHEAAGQASLRPGRRTRRRASRPRAPVAASG